MHHNREKGAYQPQKSRRILHLEVIWPETAECSLMRMQTLQESEHNRNLEKRDIRHDASIPIL